MPDQRKHRGPHPDDARLFGKDCLPTLRDAAADLSWLLSRGYAPVSATKIVGDRYALDSRQRVAVGRCACGDQALARRKEHAVNQREIAEQELWIDGYNVLTTIEAALSGGVILHGRDGCYRDMASMHGTYRAVNETVPAIDLLGELLATWQVAGSKWLLDQPVSNSGRLKTMLREIAKARGWNWEVELVRDPDPVLAQVSQIIATSDSHILDSAQRWFNLAGEAIDARIHNVWILEVGTLENR